MIRFSLRCSNGHEFEAWFRSSEAYDDQRGKGEVTCPVCGDGAPEKALMRPAVSTARRREAVEVAAHTTREKDLRAALRKLREEVVRNADYVGDRFAEEARKIHYEEAEKRGIYGEATPDEAKSLIEEGIDFAPLPVLPEDQN